MSAAFSGGSVVSLILRHAETDPARVALIYPADDGYATLTYGELARRVNAVASGLRDQGLGAGDRVVVLVPMSPELYVVLLAAASLGAVVVFVEPTSTPREIARVVGVARPKVFVGIPKAHVLRVLDRLVARVPVQVLVGPPLAARVAGALALSQLEAAGAGAAPPSLVARADDPVLLTFSSGSTGTPKGAARSHAFLAAQHAAIERLIARPEGAVDVHLSAFAIVLLSSLCAGQTAMIPALGRGGVNDVDGAALADAIDAYGVTVVSGSPAFVAPIAEARRRAGTPLATVRRVITGGAPVPLSLCELANEDLLPSGSLLVVYGSTEAEPIATIEASQVRAHTAEFTRAGAGLCVGQTDPEITVRLLQPTAEPLAVGPGGLAALEVPHGEVGEVTVSGDHVNRHYYRNAAAERATKITDEHGVVWHRTGDAGYFDAHGRLWIVGRIGDMVRRGAAVYHPAAVEATAQTLSFVRRAALIQGRDGGVVLVVQPIAADNVLAVMQHLLSTRASRTDAVVTALRNAGVEIDRVEFARTLPLDPRHRAKLDYLAIRRQYA
ncbi:MAG TPA: AMP-binding protein [Kofleriaceae bacterium]|nr:AMP-binding protein [Kofleriaceae bacterium]